VENKSNEKIRFFITQLVRKNDWGACLVSAVGITIFWMWHCAKLGLLRIFKNKEYKDFFESRE